MDRTRRGFLTAMMLAAVGTVVPEAVLPAEAEAAATGRLQIADDGKARCVIVRQPGATPAERHAAEELADTLQQITGATFEIRDITNAADPPESAIIIGPGPVASALFPEVRLDTFGAEQIALQTKGSRLLLAGGRSRGTLYAVYRFLQDHCGVRWWTPWASSIPRKPTLAVSNLSVNTFPAFEYRDPYWFAAFDGDWAARNFVNGWGNRLDENQGGKVVYKGFVHTFYPLVPPDKYFATHPEWYSLINGKRTTANAQLCTTNPALRDFMVERVREWIKESPEAVILSVSQNDCQGACQCPNCAAVDAQEGSHSGTMLALVNYIAAKIGPENPNLALDTLAYQYTRHAPKTVTPLPNVIVRLCSIECDFGAPLESSPSNKPFAADMRAWGEKSRRLYVWDYTTNFAHYTLPHPNWFSLGPNIRFFHKNGVRGVFEQGAYQSTGGEMAELRAWVLARLLWDPKLDDRKLIDEFLVGYYGKPAAPYIREYMELLHRKAKGFYLTCYNSPGAPFLDLPTLTKAERLWQQAAEAVKDDPDLLWRVRVGHLPVRYAFLQRWVSLRNAAMHAGAPEWPLPKSRKEVADAWLALATGPGPAGWSPMTHVNEGGLTPTAFVARFAQDPPDPVPLPPLPKRAQNAPPPTDIPGADPKTGVDIQDNLARLYNEGEYAEIRADTAASDGLAVWMPNSHHEWAFQVPFDRLPARARTGKWDVYVTIRVEKEDGPNANAQVAAFTAGVYDGAASRGDATISVSLADASSGYRSYRVGTITATGSQYLWVAPTMSPGARALWIDRAYLVPAK